MNIQSHPAYAKMMAEVKQAEEAAALDRQLQAAEAQQLRAQQAETYRKMFDDAVQESEVLRLAYHEKLRSVFGLHLQYQGLTGVDCPGFVQQLFARTNLPSLVKPDWVTSPAFTTTQAAVAQYFATSGKAW